LYASCSLVIDDKLPNDAGMAPVRSLSPRVRILRPISLLLPISKGMGPWSWLKRKFKVSKLMQEVRFTGNSPEKVLWLRSRIWRRRRRPRLGGMSLLNPLELRMRVLSDDRFPPLVAAFLRRRSSPLPSCNIRPACYGSTRQAGRRHTRR
jgi:hypothetical protein